MTAIAAGSLILVRHGQTASNIVHRLDSRPPGAPLTELGRQQAQDLVPTLGGVELAAVVSSVAVRAQQTAAPLAAAAGLEAQVLDGLQETDAGVLEDREDRVAHLEFVRVYGAWHAGDLEARIDEGESGREVLARFVPVVAQLRRRYLEQGGGSVVLVSHGAAIRLVAAQLAGVNGDFAATYSLPNTAMVVLEPVAPQGWRCARWDEHTPPFHPPATPHVEGPA